MPFLSIQQLKTLRPYVHGTVFLTFITTKTNLEHLQKYFYILIFLHDHQL